MKKFNVLIPLGAAVIFIMGLVVGIWSISIKSNILKNNPSSANQAQGTTAIKIPQDQFDATKSIPGTSISVAYPKNGFYGTGTILDERFSSPSGVPDSTLHSYGSFSIKTSKVYPQDNDGSNTPFDQNNVYALQVGAFQRTGNALKETLAQAVERGSMNDIGLDAKKDAGAFVTVNGHEFFVYKLDTASLKPGDAGSYWTAYAFGKKEIIQVSFNFFTGTDPVSQARFRNADQEFFQILSHIKFD